MWPRVVWLQTINWEYRLVPMQEVKLHPILEICSHRQQETWQIPINLAAHQTERPVRVPLPLVVQVLLREAAVELLAVARSEALGVGTQVPGLAGTAGSEATRGVAAIVEVAPAALGEGLQAAGERLARTKRETNSSVEFLGSHDLPR